MSLQRLTTLVFQQHAVSQKLVIMYCQITKMEQPLTNKQLKMVDCLNVEVSDSSCCPTNMHTRLLITLVSSTPEDVEVNHIVISTAKLFVHGANKIHSIIVECNFVQ
jgi:hypothetical protein